MQLIRCLSLLFALLILAPAHADTFYLGVGGIAQNMSKTTSSPDSSKSMLGQLYVPEVGVAARLHFFSIFKIMPAINYTPLAKTEADQVKKHILTIGVPLIWNKAGSPVDFKLGPGLMLYSIGGDGSSEVLNNGTTTATFYKPGTTRTSKLIYIDIGAGVEFPGAIRFDLDFLIVDAFSSRRGINAIAQVSKGIF